MGELIFLKEYREKLLAEEVEALRLELERIIKENDLYVENLPYYEYDQYGMGVYCQIPTFTITDFYY